MRLSLPAILETTLGVLLCGAIGWAVWPLPGEDTLRETASGTDRPTGFPTQNVQRTAEDRGTTMLVEDGQSIDVVDVPRLTVVEISELFEPRQPARLSGATAPPPPADQTDEDQVMVPEPAHDLSLTGRLVLDGEPVYTAVDRMTGRALIIGSASNQVDLELVEERSDGLVVRAGERLLLVERSRR